jgi:hypothetical protein
VRQVDVFALVHDDLEARNRVGYREHGEPLRTNNGRDALWDAYEEALDLAVYLRQAIWERDHQEDENDDA